MRVMPRAQQSPAGRIVEFFRTSPLETAELVLGLCRDAVSARRQKSTKAKARATKPAESTSTATPAAAPRKAKAKPAKKTRKARTRRSSAVNEPPLPMELNDTGESGDAPMQ